MQQRNAQNVRLLSADLQPRYEPNFAWKSAVSAYLALPALRAFWPMSSVDYAVANRALDLSGQGYHLSDNNTPLFNYDSLAPYVEFDGANQYLSRADGGAATWADITGTETYVNSAVRGLTLGGWWWIDQSTGSNQHLINKNNGGATLAYFLRFSNATSTAAFVIDDGVGSQTLDTVGTVSFLEWHFIAGRFDPSNQMSIWLDDVQCDAGTARASIQDTTAPLTVGATGVPNLYLDGRASMVFLCAAALSDAIILSLFHQTRAMFGV